jgi:Family of unknown function (DUF6292)
MWLEPDQKAARGLDHYVRLVGRELGLDGAGHLINFEPPVRVFLPLDARMARFPDQDVALVWDTEHGWAIGIETDSASPVVVLSYLGEGVLPTPRTVARFVRDAFDARFPGRPDPPGQPAPGADLLERLTEYAPPVLPLRPSELEPT